MPTIADLIKVLSTLPQDKQIRLYDMTDDTIYEIKDIAGDSLDDIYIRFE